MFSERASANAALAKNIVVVGRAGVRILSASTKAAFAASIACLAAPASVSAATQPAAPMVGGYQQADVRDSRIRAASRFAVTEVGGRGARLRSINAAEQQIVQGTNYKLDITVSDGQRWLVTVYQPLRGAMRVTQRQTLGSTAPVASPVQIQPIGPTAAGRGIPSQFHGTWGTGRRACSGHQGTAGRIEINDRGYIGGSGNAAVVQRRQATGNIHYFDVIFSADGDRQWEGRLALRRAGDRLAVTAITHGRTRSWSYIRCGQ